MWRIGRNETEDGVSLNKPYTFCICGDKSQLKGFLIFLDNIILAARTNRWNECLREYTVFSTNVKFPIASLGVLFIVYDPEDDLI